MNYVAGRWICLCSGEEDRGDTWKPILALRTMIHKFYPKEEAAALLARQHEAGEDAKLARLIYLKLAEHVKAAAVETPVAIEPAA